MKLILLGAPGAGKGTQAEVISQHLGIPTISTGNIIREALKSGSEMGRKAKTFMDSGKLVPDDVVIGIIQERLAPVSYTHLDVYKRQHVRMSPRKVKVVLDLIRNKPVDVALAITQHTPKAACEPVEDVYKRQM